MLPAEAEMGDYGGFVDARMRLSRITSLMASVEGLTVYEAKRFDLIPGDAVIREFIGGSAIQIPHNE